MVVIGSTIIFGLLSQAVAPIGCQQADNSSSQDPSGQAIDIIPTTPDPILEIVDSVTTEANTIQTNRSSRMGGKTGVIQSENYPNLYPNNFDKTYQINAASGDIIEVKFSSFSLEYNSVCYYDWVMVKDGSGSVLLEKACGTTIPPLIRSKTNKVEIVFHSDHSITKMGFKIDWKTIEENYACGTPPHNPGKHRGAQKDGITLWTNGLVPYEFTQYMEESDKKVVNKAISDIEEATCIRFKERNGESAYIRMSRACNCVTGVCTDPTGCTPPNDCFAGGWVQGGLGERSPSELFIGKTCMDKSNQGSVGLVIHEILHSLGVMHTQTRPDRDQYIVVKDENSNCAAQYTPCPNCITYNTPYDCMSIMHYRDYFCQKPNHGLPLTPLPTNTDCDLKSSASKLTSADKELLNKMYQCQQGCCGSLHVDGKHFANGNYKKTNQMHNNRPVFKHTGGSWCIFYGGFWKIEACDWLDKSDGSRGYGWSNVNAICPGNIGLQWRYYSWSGGSGSGPVDEGIKVECDNGCCDALYAVGKYFANGRYDKTTAKHNGSPIYKHTGNRWCIYFGGHWKIEACDWLTQGDGSRGYGWSNVNAICPGNIGPQWRYYSWSGGSGSGPVDGGIKVECV